MHFIPYGRQNIDDDDIKEVIATLKSDFMTQGPKVEEFEKVVADFHGSKYAVAFANGRAGVHGCYNVSEIKKGEEFITSPITFSASANAGVYCGGIPKFADISMENYLLDIDKTIKKISNKTKVITPVSYAGYPYDIKQLRKKLNKEIVIIHDAAHAIGAKINSKSISKDADMTILSFHPVKHIACGEGGMVLTDNKKYYEKLKLFRTHGITKDIDKLEKNEGSWYYEMIDLGYNYRLTDLQCALGISQMKKLENSLKIRNEIAEIYEKKLVGIDWVTVPPKISAKDGKNLHSYHLYPLLLDKSINKKDFFDYMRSNNIGVQVHYIPVHLMPYYKKKYGYQEGDFPVAEDFYRREVSIPMYPTLTTEEIDYVIRIIKKYVNI